MKRTRDNENNAAQDNVIPIDHELANFKERLARYEGRKSLSNFLDAFDTALTKPILLEQLSVSFKKHSIVCWSDDDIERFQNIIAKLDFRQLAQESNVVTAESTSSAAEVAPPSQVAVGAVSAPQGHKIWSTDQFEEALKELKTLAVTVNRYKQELLNSGSRYYFFVPAMEIEDALRHDFANSDDPAEKVAAYLRASFSRPTLTARKSGIACVSVNKAILGLILDVIQSLSKSETNSNSKTEPSRKGICDGLMFALLYLMNQSDPTISSHATMENEEDEDEDEEEEEQLTSREYSFFRALAHAFDLTQAMFDCILEHLVSGNDHYVDSSVALHFLAQFPFERPYKTIEEYRAGTDDKHLGELAEGGWERQFHKLPVMRWSYIVALEDRLPSSSHEAFRSQAYFRLARKYAETRRVAGGYSPLQVEEVATLSESIRWYGREIPDPILAISGVYHFDKNVLGCSWLLDDGKLTETERLAKRSDAYLLMIEQTYSDGMDEFGAALLGFYIYSQSLFAENGLFADIAKLASLINRGLQSPGKTMLEDCLGRAVSRLNKSNASLEVMMLSSYLRPRPVLASFNPSPEKVVPTPPEKAIIRSSLQSKMPIVFERFAPESVGLLVEAELLWKRLSGDFGSGSLGDWGALGTALVKPLELELVTRLGDVYLSHDYREFHRREFKREIAPKPTLGSIVHMLKAYQKLSKEILWGINQSGINLPLEINLLRGLDKILKFRNQGAHTEPFTEDDYLRLRQILFAESGFIHLANSFVDRAGKS